LQQAWATQASDRLLLALSIVKGIEELIDGNLTDAVTDIVNGINSVKQNAPQAAQEARTATAS